MHVTLRQLRVFEAVARHLSFSRAAEALHLSQPAVSMQVKQLEENVGLPLFEQLGRKVFLTEAGREVFHYSRAVSQQLGDMEGAVNQLKGLERGRLKLSVVSTANYFAPRFLARFGEKYPEITVSLKVANREAVLQGLADNETDLAIMGQPPEGLDLVAQNFMDNPLVIVAPSGHALAGEKKIPLRRLEQETFLMRESGSGTRGAMERFFAEHRVNYRAGMEMGTNEAVKQGVQAGLGLGVISLHCIELELATGRLRVLPVEGFPILRHWYVAHRTQKRLPKVAQAFKDFLLREGAASAPGKGRPASLRPGKRRE